MTEKQNLQAHCLALLANCINELNQVLQSIEESKHNETKSSAGDKYETGRAMMQMEEDKVRAQLDLNTHARQQLTQIKPALVTYKVGLGSLVKTGKRSYYLAVSLGKVQLAGTTYFCISVQAPIARALIGRSVGDQVSFNGQRETILELH